MLWHKVEKGKKPSRMLAAVLAAGLLAAGTGSAAVIMPESSRAEAVPLEMKIELGYQGKIKSNRWFPAEFTVTNKGEDLSGELVVEIASNLNGKDIRYTAPVDLPANSTKTIVMSLPGTDYTKDNNRVSFYKGKGGQKVQIAGGDPRLEPEVLPHQLYMVGIAARDPETMNHLVLLNQKGYSVATVPVKAGPTASESLMLDGLDALVFNDATAAEWQPENLQALKGWLQRGGTLILGGGAAYNNLPDALKELSPVAVTGTSALSRLDALSAVGAKEPELAGPLTVSKGTLKAGATAVFSQDGVPLLARSQSGFGIVYYTAYDLGLEPLASWQGNSSMWESVLGGEIQWTSDLSRTIYPATVGPMFWGVGEVLDSFPTLKPPGTSGLIWILLLYAAAAGPVLYVILKKADKREWAWVGIPVLAILASGGIYMSGASGRTHTLGQLMTIAELNGEGQAYERSAAAVFVPKGGSYEMKGAGSAYALALGAGNGGIRYSVERYGAVDSYVSREDGGSKVRYTGVPYWSIRKAWFYEEEPRKSGGFGYSLELDGDQLKGQIQNNTGADLEDVVLLYGDEWFHIGDIKAGQSLPVTAALTTGTVTGKEREIPMTLAQTIYPYSGPTSDAQIDKRRGLLAAYLENRLFKPGAYTAVLGFSQGMNSERLRVNGKSLLSDEVKLWTQAVRIASPEGEITP